MKKQIIDRNLRVTPDTEVLLNEGQPTKIASMVYNNFIVGEYCVVPGFTMWTGRLHECGKIILKYINDMYDDEWTYHRKDRTCRKRRFIEFTGNVVGGPIAHKAFGWSRYVKDNIPTYIIWRCQ